MSQNARLSTGGSTKRQSGIELLRIFACFFVIILHYNNGNVGGASSIVVGTLPVFFNLLSESVCFCAVDLFVMISGFFLCASQKRSLSKIVFLFFEAALIRFCFICADIVKNGGSFSVSGVVGCLFNPGYFLVLYAVTYLISPWINRAFSGLEKKRHVKVVLLLFFIFSVTVTIIDILSGKNAFGIDWNYDSPIGIAGSMEGYSIVNFTLCYIIGGLIRNCFNFRIPIFRLILLYGGDILLLLVWGYISPATAFLYSNPLVIISAALLIMIFSRFDFTNKAVNELAKAAFTCYLSHASFIPLLHIGFHVKKAWYIMLPHMLVSAVLLYLISYAIFKVYALLTGRFHRFISPYIDKIKVGDTDEIAAVL